METAGISAAQKQRFYCDNFVDLMGSGPGVRLRQHA